jgi:5'-nucleotidase
MNVIYSGTVAACIEACLLEIPAIAFSLCSFELDSMELSEHTIKTVLSKIDLKNFPAHTLLNVNIPPVGMNDFKGSEVCGLSRNRYVEDFDIRKDPKVELLLARWNKNKAYRSFSK